MAKLPSGWIFIPHYKDLNHIELEERKLVTCRECVYHHYDIDRVPYCDNVDYRFGWEDDDYCSRGEKRDEDRP